MFVKLSQSLKCCLHEQLLSILITDLQDFEPKWTCVHMQQTHPFLICWGLGVSETLTKGRALQVPHQRWRRLPSQAVGID